jgi:polyisoprenoid-binding protein YceI
MGKIKWVADPAHTEIAFKVKHLMITTVTGHLKQYDIEVETDDDDFTSASKILFTADIDSISTNNAQRDTHLKSADFFHAELYPQIKFVGKKYEKHGDNYSVTGDLTIRDVTKPLTLDVEFGGLIKDPWGQTRAGFTVKGAIRRKDFGLVWDAMTEAGHVVVSNDIRLQADVELVKQQESITVQETERVHEAETS